MERCKPRLHHCHHRDLRLQLLVALLVFLWLTNKDSLFLGAHSDAVNLLRGGFFPANPIQFGVYPVLDVLAHGLNTQLPYWTCVHGGVQLWDASVYLPPLPNNNATFVLHMNSRAGGGHLVSVPMYTPRANAEYTVSLSMACNPHGGPRNQSLMAIVFDDEGKEMEPQGEVMVVVSNANSSMENLNWETRQFKMLGTGRCMYLYLMSLVKGYYGPLVANVQVNLVNVLDNGSFEMMVLESDERFDKLTKDIILVSPRANIFPGWNVETGKMKVLMTGRGNPFQSATDGSQYAVELNAMRSSGEISAMFALPDSLSISPNHECVLLFDTASNPRQIDRTQFSHRNEANSYTILGKVGVKVVGMQSNKQLLDEEYDMNSTGFTTGSVGWMTVNYSFKMEEDRTAKVSFRSLMKSMSYGPFLDNVCVYEVKSKGEWIKVNTPGYETPNGNDVNKEKLHIAESLLVLLVTTALMFLVSTP